MLSRSFVKQTKFIFGEIWTALKLREFYRSIIYFCLLGLVIPSFSEYMFVFLKQRGVTLEQMGYLTVIGLTFSVIFTIVYYKYLKEAESRTLLLAGLVVGALTSAFVMAFVLGYTFGLSPFAYIVIFMSATGGFVSVMGLMTGTVLFAKLIPVKVEASMFALLMGLMNLGNAVTARYWGIFVAE